MSHEVETMAWAHEVPWHGLGNRVEGNVSIEQMLVAAGLDWEVNQHPCFTEIDGKRIAVGRKALVRASDQKVFSVTGDNWKPFQNRDALEFFREYTEAGGATLETAGALKGGRIVWGLARVATGFTINGSDHVKGYILLVSPHEVGSAITVRTTSVRVVCANTLAMAGGVRGSGAEYRQSHVRDFDTAAARATVQLVKDQIEQMRIDAEALRSLKMSEFDNVRFLAQFFQPDKASSEVTGDAYAKILMDDPKLMGPAMAGIDWAIKKAPGADPGNAWGTLNGVTYWADHMAGRNKDTRLFNSWLGDNARRKAEVKTALLAMV